MIRPSASLILELQLWQLDREWETETRRRKGKRAKKRGASKSGDHPAVLMPKIRIVKGRGTASRRLRHLPVLSTLMRDLHRSGKILLTFGGLRPHADCVVFLCNTLPLQPRKLSSVWPAQARGAAVCWGYCCREHLKQNWLSSISLSSHG